MTDAGRSLDDGTERTGDSKPNSNSRGDHDGRIADGSSVLLLAPTDAATEHAYTDLEPSNDPATARVLAVTYSRTPDEWATDWRTHVGALPGYLGIVAVGEATRSMAATGTTQGATTAGNAPGGHRVLRSVGSPADLTGVGMGISERLAHWEDSSGPGDVRPVVSFGSLSVLLDHVPIDRVFQFLHVLSGRVARTGAVGYYYLDPAAHDERTVATLTVLFDAVVQHTDNGWEIKSR